MSRFSGQRMRESRIRAGKSREQLAVELGRGYSTIAAWENGPNVPPLRVLCRVADALGVQLTDLVEDDSEVAT